MNKKAGRIPGLYIYLIKESHIKQHLFLLISITTTQDLCYDCVKETGPAMLDYPGKSSTINTIVPGHRLQLYRQAL